MKRQKNRKPRRKKSRKQKKSPRLQTTRREFLAASGGVVASSLLPFPLLSGRAAAQTLAPPFGPLEDERKAAALDFSHNTYQEYQPVTVLPVHPDDPHLRVVRTSDGEFKLLTVSRDRAAFEHEISLFEQDPDSYSGWRQASLRAPGLSRVDIQRFEVFVEDDVVFLLFHSDFGSRPGPVTLFRLVGERLERVQFSREIEDLLLENYEVLVAPDVGGRTVIQGSSIPGYYVLSVSGGNWEIADFRGTGSGDTYRILPGFGGFDLRLLRIFRDNRFPNRFFHRNGNWIGGRIQWEPERECSLNLGIFTTGDVHPVPGGASTRDEFLLHQQGGVGIVWHVKGLCSSVEADRLNFQPGGPTGLRDVIPGFEQTDEAVIFAGTLGTAGRAPIWLKRQRGLDARGFAVWDDWEELDNGLLAMTATTRMLEGSDIFALNRDLDLYHLYSDTEEGTWHDQFIERPRLSTDEVEEITSHCLELTSVDEAGAPVPRTELQLSSSTYQVVYVNGVIVHLESRKPVVLETDDSARLTIKIRANQLTSPQLEVHVPDFMEAGTTQIYAPSMATYRRLAGLEPGLELTGEELQKSGVLSNRLDGGEADDWADFIKQAGERMLASQMETQNSEGAVALADMEPVAWVFDFTAGRGHGRGRRSDPVLQILTGSAALSFDLTALSGPHPNVVPHDELFFRRVGDFFRRAARNLRDITTLVVKFVAGKIEIAMTSAKESLNRVFENVAAGARLIGNVLAVALERMKVAFQEIANAIGNLIERIKALFGWQDILVTKRAYDIIVNRFMDNLVRSIRDDGVPLVEQAFESLQGSLDQVFADIHAVLGNATANDLMTLGGRNPLDDRSMEETYQSNANMSNFALSLIESYSPDQPDLSAAQREVEATPEFEEFFDALRAFFSQERFDELDARFRDRLVGFFDGGTDPATLLDSTLEVFFLALEEFATTAVEFFKIILVLLMQLIARMIEIFQATLNQPIQLPVLTPLYRLLTGEDEMRTLDLLNLSVAIPTTILYRLTFGGLDGSAPFTEEELPDLERFVEPLGDLHILLTDPGEREFRPFFDEGIALRLRILSAVSSLPAPIADAAIDIAVANKIPIKPLPILDFGTKVLRYALRTPFIAMTGSNNGRWSSLDVARVAEFSIASVRLAGTGLAILTTGGGTRGIPVAGPTFVWAMSHARFWSGWSIVTTAAVEGEYPSILGGLRNVSASIPGMLKPLIDLGQVPKVGPVLIGGLAVHDVAWGYIAVTLNVAQLIWQSTGGDTFEVPDDPTGSRSAWMFEPERDDHGRRPPPHHHRRHRHHRREGLRGAA